MYSPKKVDTLDTINFGKVSGTLPDTLPKSIFILLLLHLLVKLSINSYVVITANSISSSHIGFDLFPISVFHIPNFQYIISDELKY